MSEQRQQTGNTTEHNPPSSSPAEGLEQEIQKALKGITPGEWFVHAKDAGDNLHDAPVIRSGDPCSVYVAATRSIGGEADAEFIASAARLLRAALSALQQKNAECSLGTTVPGNASTQSTPNTEQAIEFWCAFCDVGLPNTSETWTHTANGHAVMALPAKLRSALREARQLIGRVVLAPCKVCEQDWPHFSVLSTSPLCETCRHSREIALRDTANEAIRQLNAERKRASAAEAQRDALRTHVAHKVQDLVEDVRPKFESCAMNGETWCRDQGRSTESSCSNCNRWRWANEISALLASVPGLTKEEQAEGLLGNTFRS